MTEQSTRKTGNEPVQGVDPGGTRPKPAGGDLAAKPQPAVQSGDQNENPKRP